MTIIQKDLDTKYAHWFRNVSRPKQAKAEILKNFAKNRSLTNGLNRISGSNPERSL